MWACGTCGRENPDDASFCGGCGSPRAASTPSREERKVVSVVFADLVGSTARAEALDPEDVRAVLAPYHARVRTELERFGGTVEKFIGDAVVGVFGAPVSHEDDPERAVRAALAIQDAIGELNEVDPTLELEVRVGVNTGEALVNLDAHPESGEAMVSGDVINTAARLQSAAPPGGILVGEQTYRATERAIDYETHPPVEAKGKAEPIAVWRALSTRARIGIEDVALGRAALVGRERELGLLADALERVRSDERPQLVTLVGVPGIGKSRLVHELSQIVEYDEELIVWRRGRSLPYGEGVAYWALSEIVKAQAGILESDDADDAGAKLSRAVADLLGDATEAAWVERNLRPLVGLASGDDQPARSQAFAARRRFLEALAETGPAVLVFEDLHWADDDLLDFVDELADRLDAVPLLLVCTARPELLARRPGWGGGKLNSTTLSLQPLSADDTARLLLSLLERSVLPAETQSAIVERAAGIPLFAEEYVRMLEGGAVGHEVPETLQGVVAARVDGLPADEKMLLQDAAVLGKVFWTDALATLSGVDHDALDERLRALERKEFVRRERRSAVEGERQYVFLHALVRDVAYGQIPRATRSQKHRATADWISGLPVDRAEDRAETLAHHLESAISYGESAGVDVSDLRPAAVSALREAGDRAWALNILSRATSFYRRAIDAAPADEPDPELRFLYGRGMVWAEGVRGDAAADLEAAIDGLAAVGKRELAGVAAITLERYLWNKGTPSMELQDRALQLIGGAGATSAHAEVLSFLASRWAIMGRSEEALELGEQAAEITREIGDRVGEARALNGMGIALANAGRLDEGVEVVTRGLELALESGSDDAPRAYINVASLEFEVGRLELATRRHREGLAVAERFESTHLADWLSRELVVDAFTCGSWDEALDGARHHLAVSARRGEPHYMDIPMHLIDIAIVLAREGRLLELELAALLERARGGGDPQTVRPALAYAAHFFVEAGRSDDARGLLGELAGTDGYPGYWATVAALAWAQLQDDPFPEKLFGSWDTPWIRAARLIGAGEPAAAADVLREIDARTDEAAVRLHAGRMLVSSDPAEAGRQLELAAAFWRSVGATAALAAVDEVAATMRQAAS
jgi:class 3 adenylate cyclase/tetratricopeptide (TPR) repeat protein